MTPWKKFINLALLAITFFLTPTIITSCDDDEKDTWEEYTDWRDANTAWLQQQSTLLNPDGTPVFSKIAPQYNPMGMVYIKYIGERHPENLKPLYTSYVTVNYTLHLYDGTKVDSAAAFTVNLNSQSLIPGWAIALQQMNVNDSVEVLMPYNVAYGSTGSGVIPPYSALRFNLRLTDIPYYEIRP